MSSFIVALFTMARTQKSKCLALGAWLNELGYIHIMEYCAAIKKNEKDFYKMIWGNQLSVLF